MKGISPLIASVLLIAFTVAVATIVMGWFTTFTRTTTANVSTQANNVVGCSSASVQITHVYNGRVIVENTGFKNFTNVVAAIINTSGGMCNSTATTLAQGQIKAITVTGDCGTLDDTTFDRAVVTTDCGGISDTVTDKSYFG